jgi:hypothetical protein
MEQRPSVQDAVHHVTKEIRHILRADEDEPVGVMSAYRNSILRLADAVDRLAAEMDSRSKPR